MSSAMRLRRLATMMTLGCLGLSSSVWADNPDPMPSNESVGHKHLLDPSAKGIEKRPLFTPLDVPNDRATTPGPVVNREVIGYLPYWEMDTPIPHWEYLTVLAWFAVEMNSQGDATSMHGWGGADTEALVEEAHAHGVKVAVTITNFSKASIGILLKSPTARQNAIDTCLELMAIHQADGINIDFEFVPESAKDEFVVFMSDLKDAVTEVAPNGEEGHVTLAGPAVDWGGAYDYDQLLIHTDGIMVMAYGYHWSGSDPGPISPLKSGGKWGEGKNSIAWTIDDYLQWGGLENRHHIYIGLPWYGREWTVANAGVPGTSLGASNAVTFSKAKKEAAQEGKQYDDDSMTAYYHITRDEKLWQVWYDDGPSFEAKIAYVAEKDLGGIGIWALGYDGGYEDLWEAIANTLTEDEPPPPADDGGGDDGGSVEPDAGPPVGDSVASVEDVLQEMDVLTSQETLASDVLGGEMTSAPKPSKTQQTISLSHKDAGGCGLSPHAPSSAWALFFFLWLGWRRTRSFPQ